MESSKDESLAAGDSSLPIAAAESACVNLSDQEAQYEGFIRQAVENLKKAKSRHDDLEAFYCQAMDYERIDAARNKIFNRILALAAEKEK